LVIVNQLVRCPASKTPFFRQTKLNGGLPEAVVLKVAVVPTQLAKLVNAVAVASLCNTVTVNVHVEVLPCASVAMLVTVVVPTAKVLPLAGLLATVTPGQLSVALTLNVTLLLQAPGAALTVIALGQVICGT
jgi:hypothetical protein